MSLIIRLKDADYSRSGLPKLEKTVKGFPLEGLVALYLFEDGQHGQQLSSVIDSSGLGNHGVVFNGYANPQRIAEEGGVISTNDLGIAIDSGCPITPNKSIVWAGFHTVMNFEQETGAFPALSGSSEGITSPSSPLNNRGAALNIDLASGNYANNGVGVYLSDKGLGPTPGEGGLRFSLNKPQSDKLGVVAYSLSSDTGEIKLKVQDGTSRSEQYDGLIDYDRSRNGTEVIGIRRHGSAGVTGEVHVCAIYDKALDDFLLSQAWSAARELLISRGLSPL